MTADERAVRIVTLFEDGREHAVAGEMTEAEACVQALALLIPDHIAELMSEPREGGEG